MEYEYYERLRALINAEKNRLHDSYVKSLNFIKEGESEYAREVYNKEYRELMVLGEELHKAAAEPYRNHPKAEMRKFWGFES